MDTRRLILYIFAIVFVAPLMVPLYVTGCTSHPKPQPVGNVQGPYLNVNTEFGGSNVVVNSILCAGKVALAQGSATVTDQCFSGATNIVVCSDVTSANAARCVPGKGQLAIEGHGEDVIAFARVK